MNEKYLLIKKEDCKFFCKQTNTKICSTFSRKNFLNDRLLISKEVLKVQETNHENIFLKWNLKVKSTNREVFGVKQYLWHFDVHALLSLYILSSSFLTA